MGGGVLGLGLIALPIGRMDVKIKYGIVEVSIGSCDGKLGC